MKEPIAITSIGTVSPLGSSSGEIWQNYIAEKHFFESSVMGNEYSLAAPLPNYLKAEAEALRSENSKYKHLDASVLYGVLAARKLKDNFHVVADSGINLGSSRGATGLFEKYHEEYIKTGKTSTYSSPNTTLGNISSWVAQDLQLSGPEFSHSVTCSTGMHAVLNGIAWINSGMAPVFLAGGSEAPLTGFTIAQMKAMKIYADEKMDFPCRSLDMKKKRNTMILGEAAGLIGMVKASVAKDSLAYIKGVGFSNETLKHGASLSRNGKCLQKSMEMAAGSNKIDAVVMHAPGTIGGDSSEVNAIKNVFGKRLPALTSNKWKVGHSFAASGILNMEMAILMLQEQKFLNVPFSEFQQKPQTLQNVLVNSVGFGGNAVSILLSRTL